MLTTEALAIIDLEIVHILKVFNIPVIDPVGEHVLNTVTEPEKLYSLNKALLYLAVNAQPRDLYEEIAVPVGEELYKVDQTNYVRVPAVLTNAGGEFLDMDEVLCQTACYFALFDLYGGMMYETLTDRGITNYLRIIEAYEETTP